MFGSERTTVVARGAAFGEKAAAEPKPSSYRQRGDSESKERARETTSWWRRSSRGSSYDEPRERQPAARSSWWRRARPTYDGDDSPTAGPEGRRREDSYDGRRRDERDTPSPPKDYRSDYRAERSFEATG